VRELRNKGAHCWMLVREHSGPDFHKSETFKEKKLYVENTIMIAIGHSS